MVAPLKRDRPSPAGKLHRRHVEARKIFLETIAKGLSSSAAARACEHLEVSRRTFYHWRDGNSGTQPQMVVEGFAEAWDEAIDIGNARLEDEAFRRAHDGIDKPIYYQGKRVDVIREYSDNLLKFIIEGRMPDKYRSRKDNSESTGETKVIITGGLVKDVDG